MHVKILLAEVGRRIFLFVAGLMVICCIATSVAVAAGPTENAVKVAYLYNFAQFVDWPPDTWTANDETLNICILGVNPFGRALDSIRGKTIKKREVSVVQIDTAAEADQCQILFVSQSERQQILHIIEQVDRKPVLTISDMTNFVQSGGMIGLFTDEGRVQFEINKPAAEQAGLTISSHVLRLAKKGARND